MVLWLWNLAWLYTLLFNMYCIYIPHLKSLPHLFLKIYIYPLKCFFFLKQPKIEIFLVCKILTNGAMGMKLGKVVYLIAQHLHTTFEISTSFIYFSKYTCWNAFLLWKSGKKFTLFWSVKYSLMALCVWNLSSLYTLLLNMYIPNMKSLPHFFLKI